MCQDNKGSEDLMDQSKHLDLTSDYKNPAVYVKLLWIVELLTNLSRHQLKRFTCTIFICRSTEVMSAKIVWFGLLQDNRHCIE